MPQNRSMLILKTGSTVPPVLSSHGDFEVWFRAGLGRAAEQAPVVAPHLGDPLPDPAAISAVVITGSPHMVTDEAPWSLACERWIRDLVGRGTPLLGVCYGHQLLARAMGGVVADNPLGREIGTVTVELTEHAADDPLFAGLGSPLIVQESHMQSVVMLPPGARLLAHNAHDPHQAFAIGDRAWGVQFHPEFDAQIVRGYIEHRSADLRREGLDPHALARGARDSDYGPALLRAFAALLDA